VRSRFAPNGRLLLPLLLPSTVSILLLLCRVIFTESPQFLFLQWNLILAWLPLVGAWGLARSLENHHWSTWRPILYGAVWIVFLPNSFYLVTDFIHLEVAVGISKLFDVVMLTMFALSGMLLGWVSVYIVHSLLKTRWSERRTWKFLIAVFLLCSFAVYLGRFLGWNSWDIIFNPADILFDVSDRVLNPALYPNTFTTTSLFFTFIATSYVTFYSLIDTMRQYK
jgi:uncharacterized membrane protein